MLLALSIRDVVLIEKLDIAFESGLSVLTGETGAGKSILLDSLGLALGARGDSGLVRRDAGQLSVTAEFSLPKAEAAHPVRAMLEEQGFQAGEDNIVLRRVVTADGRSRAFIDGQPVSVSLLRQIGDELVEIHGQFESHGLMNPVTHRGVLDAFAELTGELGKVRIAHRAWRRAAETRASAEAELLAARKEEDLLRHSLEELAALDPKPGEEDQLSQRRTVMMHGEKLLEGMNAALAALTQKGEVEASLRAAQRALERVAEKADGKLDPVIAALDRAAIEAAEATGLLDHVSSSIDLDPGQLDKVEERLFALRATARKHSLTVEDLPAFRDKLTRQLAALDSGGDHLVGLARAEQAARAAYVEAARHLSRLRVEAARRMDDGVMSELVPLKLEKATFRTKVEPMDEADWAETGLDRVAFEVATNPGAAPGPIGKIASGGELSRFMLALKVVLARVGAAGTIVFDEVDSGIGGATAAAVGERLALLARDLQVLVVTHSPQVAATGRHHWKVAKTEANGAVATAILALSPDQRREEIARMLAGAEITEHARAAAASLMGLR